MIIRFSRPADSEKDFIRLLSRKRLNLTSLTLPDAVDAMIAFYRTVCYPMCWRLLEGDMLLCQWGIYDWGKGEKFEFDLTRQFISFGGLVDNSMSQMHLTFRFAVTNELQSIPADNRWFRKRAELHAFRSFALAEHLVAQIQPHHPQEIELRWELV
jgi:hypothetical protein